MKDIIESRWKKTEFMREWGEKDRTTKMSAEERKANLAEVKEMETEIRYHMKKREIEKTYLDEYEE